ncbi:sialidase family protein [Aporhodopirellula aestuarii]|uniref:Glycoside hydrolase n=1 Tax=Aporhodopirellula aestuarii TaxID=2950107 RepID=A0ABT0U7P4_9BACT|nr:sialidase family protein [Aporhodopirellula aestuarii]MCM2372937.1 glycoside hydrolase [Aporhodopirellula aestuarii]
MHLFLLIAGSLLFSICHSYAQELEIQRSVIAEGTAEFDWTQARTVFVPGEDGLFLTTMSQTSKIGSHGYHDVYMTVSRDGGRTWTTPEVVPALKRVRRADDYEVVAGDIWPHWHAESGKVLLTGKTFHFAGGTRENYLREEVFYAVMDPETLECGPLRTLSLPDVDHGGSPFVAPNAGCHQVVLLPNGDVLLPIRYQKNAQQRIYTTMVARCGFDGETLTYREHGSEHTLNKGRGLYEPSVTLFRDQAFLTMRADHGAFVSRSDNGIRFTAEIPWMFDDGTPLGSYNTQQHWMTVGDKLYLVYTRPGAQNDHIMRHRAPLFVAEVDPERLVAIRSTEQVLVPENAATLGNSGVCQIHANESWVTVAEGLIRLGARKGENNKVFLVKVARP